MWPRSVFQPGFSLPSHNFPPQDVGPANLAYLTSLTLGATDDWGNPMTFDFLSEVHILVSSPGLPIVKIANSVTFPSGVSTLSLNIVPSVNLIQYLGAGCTIQMEVFGTYPAQDVNLGGQLVATVGL